MSLAEMRQWRQKTLLGVSLKVVPPTGQYDPTKLVNLGSNRWTFKPELGFSHAGATGCSMRTRGSGSSPGTPSSSRTTRISTPVRSPRPRTRSGPSKPTQLRRQAAVWVSLDGNFWYGGGRA